MRQNDYNGDGEFNADDTTVSQNLMTYYTNFAKNGYV